MGADSFDLVVYVINLPRRSDRRDHITELLRHDDQPYLLTSEIWGTAFDGLDLSRRCAAQAFVEFPNWCDPASENPWWSRPLKYGEIGCALAHDSVWRHALDTGATHAVVLEDDAVFAPGLFKSIREALSVISSHGLDCDLLYLGRVALEHDTPVLPGLVRPGYSHCTYAYLLSRNGLETLAAAGLPNAIIPVDEFLPAMYLDHPRADVRAQFQKRLNAFAFEPSLVAQLPKRVAGSDTEDTPFLGVTLRRANAR